MSQEVTNIDLNASALRNPAPENEREQAKTSSIEIEKHLTSKSTSSAANATEKDRPVTSIDIRNAAIARLKQITFKSSPEATDGKMVRGPSVRRSVWKYDLARDVVNKARKGVAGASVDVVDILHDPRLQNVVLSTDEFANPDEPILRTNPEEPEFQNIITSRLLVSAMRTIQVLPPEDLNSWFRIGSVHSYSDRTLYDTGYCIHGRPDFGPWHQQYCMAAEQAFIYGAYLAVAADILNRTKDEDKQKYFWSLYQPYLNRIGLIYVDFSEELFLKRHANFVVYPYALGISAREDILFKWSNPFENYRVQREIQHENMFNAFSRRPGHELHLRKSEVVKRHRVLLGKAFEDIIPPLPNSEARRFSVALPFAAKFVKDFVQELKDRLAELTREDLEKNDTSTKIADAQPGKYVKGHTGSANVICGAQNACHLHNIKAKEVHGGGVVPLINEVSLVGVVPEISKVGLAGAISEISKVGLAGVDPEINKIGVVPEVNEVGVVHQARQARQFHEVKTEDHKQVEVGVLYAISKAVDRFPRESVEACLLTEMYRMFLTACKPSEQINFNMPKDDKTKAAAEAAANDLFIKDHTPVDVVARFFNFANQTFDMIEKALNTPEFAYDGEDQQQFADIRDAVKTSKTVWLDSYEYSDLIIKDKLSIRKEQAKAECLEEILSYATDDEWIEYNKMHARVCHIYFKTQEKAVFSVQRTGVEMGQGQHPIAQFLKENPTTYTSDGWPAFEGKGNLTSYVPIEYIHGYMHDLGAGPLFDNDIFIEDYSKFLNKWASRRFDGWSYSIPTNEFKTTLSESSAVELVHQIENLDAWEAVRLIGGPVGNVPIAGFDPFFYFIHANVERHQEIFRAFTPFDEQNMATEYIYDGAKKYNLGKQVESNFLSFVPFLDISKGTNKLGEYSAKFNYLPDAKPEPANPQATSQIDFDKRMKIPSEEEAKDWADALVTAIRGGKEGLDLIEDFWNAILKKKNTQYEMTFETTCTVDRVTVNNQEHDRLFVNIPEVFDELSDEAIFLTRFYHLGTPLLQKTFRDTISLQATADGESSSYAQSVVLALLRSVKFSNFYSLAALDPSKHFGWNSYVYENMSEDTTKYKEGLSSRHTSVADMMKLPESRFYLVRALQNVFHKVRVITSLRDFPGSGTMEFYLVDKIHFDDEGKKKTHKYNIELSEAQKLYSTFQFRADPESCDACSKNNEIVHFLHNRVLSDEGAEERILIVFRSAGRETRNWATNVKKFNMTDNKPIYDNHQKLSNDYVNLALDELKRVVDRETSDDVLCAAIWSYLVTRKIFSNRIVPDEAKQEFNYGLDAEMKGNLETYGVKLSSEVQKRSQTDLLDRFFQLIRASKLLDVAMLDSQALHLFDRRHIDELFYVETESIEESPESGEFCVPGNDKQTTAFPNSFPTVPDSEVENLFTKAFAQFSSATGL